MSLFSYLLNVPDNNDEIATAAWKELASSYELEFIPPFPIMGRPQITGEFRSHHLKLYASPKTRASNEFRNTYAELEINPLTLDKQPPKSNKNLGERLRVKDVRRLLLPNGLHYRLRGELRIKGGGQKVYYSQQGLESDLKYLRFLLNLLSNLARGYPAVVALGGEAVPALQKIANDRDSVLRNIAPRILREIASETRGRLSGRLTTLLCPKCLVHPDTHRVWISWWRMVQYYGCRVCGQSREFLEKSAIAVLDEGMKAEQTEQNGVLRVNWLARRALFDFDEVQIVQVTDRNVEEFAVQIGNDTDNRRKANNQQITCIVSTGCQLSENTWHILQHTFDRVEMNELAGE